MRENYIVNNKNGDPPGIYNISYINNSVKHYSLKLNINKESDESYNVHVDYLDITLNGSFNYEQYESDIQFKINIFHQHKPCKIASVAVVDLDDTLINENCEILIENLNNYLIIMKRFFDYIIIWSHGNQSHVNYAFNSVLAPYKKYFSDIIARSSQFKSNNKGIGIILRFLNRKYDVCQLSHTMLVDDQSCNYNRDYDYFIHTPCNDRLYNKRMWTMLKEVTIDIYDSMSF